MQDSFSDDFVSAVDMLKKALAVKKRRLMKGKGESRASVARPKILVYIYIYIYKRNSEKLAPRAEDGDPGDG